MTDWLDKLGTKLIIYQQIKPGVSSGLRVNVYESLSDIYYFTWSVYQLFATFAAQTVVYLKFPISYQKQKATTLQVAITDLYCHRSESLENIAKRNKSK